MSENLSIYLLILNLQFLSGEPNYHKYYLAECTAIVDGTLVSLPARVESSLQNQYLQSQIGNSQVRVINQCDGSTLIHYVLCNATVRLRF